MFENSGHIHVDSTKAETYNLLGSYFCQNHQYSINIDIIIDFVKVFPIQTHRRPYVCHPISSDNGLISQKLLLDSEFNYPCMWPWLLPIYV